jgi:predicted MPP superfamily phosphohydrolase
MKLFAYLINANDSTYGMETRDKTTFIVTSGIGDWEIGFKTGCKAEFCVIDIAKQTLN